MVGSRSKTRMAQRSCRTGKARLALPGSEIFGSEFRSNCGDLGVERGILNGSCPGGGMHDIPLQASVLTNGVGHHTVLRDMELLGHSAYLLDGARREVVRSFGDAAGCFHGRQYTPILTPVNPLPPSDGPQGAALGSRLGGV